MGMGKSALDAMPELRRAGVTASGNSFSLGGRTMDAPAIAQTLRLQVRPVANGTACIMQSCEAGSCRHHQMVHAVCFQAGLPLKSLAIHDSVTELPVDKTCLIGQNARTSQPLRSMNIVLKCIANLHHLTLQARTPSRPSTPLPTRPPSSAAAPAASYSAPAAPAGSAAGLDGLATWIASNYTGMGKSAADVLPELRRKGITASGSNFNMAGKLMDAPGVAQALRLQVRPNSRPVSPVRSAAVSVGGSETHRLLVLVCRPGPCLHAIAQPCVQLAIKLACKFSCPWQMLDLLSVSSAS